MSGNAEAPQIRIADLADISALEPLAGEFYASSKFLTGFNIEVFRSNWRNFIAGGKGVILLLEDSKHLIIGALGGLAYNDPCSGALLATELFWFVSPAARGHGVKLLRAFEEWAHGLGCESVQMVHLMDSMPQKLGRFYARAGYEAMEIRYTKALCAH